MEDTLDIFNDNVNCDIRFKIHKNMENQNLKKEGNFILKL